MNLILLVAAGGALGSVLRYLFSKAAGEWFPHGFPYGTLGVNVIGSFAAGLLYVLLVERSGAAEWRAALMIGLLGGFTTFSAFSVDSIRLAEEVGAMTALANIVGNVGLSLGACVAGIWLMRHA